MQKLITINNLYKKYDDYIFEDFSYSFNKTGLYVLFGESGCGKTTLFNILLGHTNYEKGTISINGKNYQNKVENNDLVCYITQETYFVDYLKVKENIELCSNDSNKIKKLLELFKLTNKIDNYPKQLSGGEKQRLAILIALLKNKKIIFLDEPTSSLDKNNKKIIFELLKKLKNEVLIICASHDKEILNYSDATIDFSNLQKYKNKALQTNEIIDYEKNYTVNHLYDYIKKGNKENQKSNHLLKIILTFSMLVILFTANYKNKLYQTIEKKYKVNYLTFYCNIKKESCNKIFNNKNVLSVDYSYAHNIPLYRPEGDEVYGGTIDFETDIMVLPSVKKAFPFENIFLYGKYPDKNEIVLGYEKALKIMPNLSKEILNKEITIKTMDGNNTFKISGILKPNSKEMKSYYGDESIDYKYFVNGAFTKKYINDNIIGYNEEDTGKGVFYVFYNNFNNLLKDYYKYKTNNLYKDDIYVIDLSYNYFNILKTMQNLTIVILPITLFTIIITIMYYYQALKINLAHTYYIFSVYEYYGYNYKNVKKAMIKNNFIEFTKISLKALIIAIIIAYLINFINISLKIFNFELFVIDIRICLGLFILLEIIAFLLSLNIFNKLKRASWYEVVRNGDLI